MAHKFINEVNPGETVDDIYLVKEPILRSTSKGDLYIAMYLGDRTGQLNGRMWQATEAVYNALPKPGFVHVQGRSELYQGNLQIVVNNVTLVDAAKVAIEDFLPRTKKDVGQMFEEVKQILRGVKNKQVQGLLAEYFSDKALMENFCKAPGGMKLHHSYLGGLLEHVHSMLKVAAAILPLYPEVQADLVLAGIFIHDMGKTDELTYEMAFAYTDGGQLIGHITKSLLLLHEMAGNMMEKGKPLDEHLLNLLGHIVLAHHGQYEFGSPKLPATAEAFMVNYIDDLDAKINQVTTAIDKEPGDADWTAWQNALQTRLYRKRVD